MNAIAERRTHFRTRVLKAAHIVMSDNAAKLDCAALDLSAEGVRLRLATTYGIPHRFDVVVGGRRRSGRSIWRTDTELGVMFSQPSQSRADNRHESDIVPLIELLRMAAEKWPLADSDDIPESELFQRDRALLEMWPEACRRAHCHVHEFPAGVIKLWQQKMGSPN